MSDFYALPIELVQHVVSYLPNDVDLCHFALVCRQTHSILQSTQCGIWRKRFIETFDIIPNKSSFELKLEYQRRQKLIRRGCTFTICHESDERKNLELFRDLICGSYANTLSAKGFLIDSPSKNIEQLFSLVKRTDLLNNVFRYMFLTPSCDPYLVTIQLVLTHWSLDLSLNCPTFNFPSSQKAVYGHPDDYPLFLDAQMKKVNVEYFLHIVNFFKYHMVGKEEMSLYPSYLELSDEDFPKAWTGPLHQGVKKLGSHWKGTYAYLHHPKEITILRTNEASCQNIYTDAIDTDADDGFQSLTLDFSNPNPVWPAVFERHLHSLPSPTLVKILSNYVSNGNGKWSPQRSPMSFVQEPITPPTTPDTTPRQPFFNNFPRSNLPIPKAGTDYLPFTGTGHDAVPFHCGGNLHALPPQHGIPGWQRISLLKYFTPDSTPSSPSPDTSNFFSNPFMQDQDLATEFEETELWAYEGVVLPGGMIMLGRWWSVADEEGRRECTGPWIFWNVPGNEVVHDGLKIRLSLSVFS